MTFETVRWDDKGEPTTILVTIGNSDDKLTQAEWAKFQARVDHIVRNHADEVYGRFHSLPDQPWQTAAWSFRLPVDDPDDLAPRSKDLQAKLTFVARAFRQDSIAWTEGPTTFLTPPGAES